MKLHVTVSRTDEAEIQVEASSAEHAKVTAEKFASERGHEYSWTKVHQQVVDCKRVVS